MEAVPDREQGHKQIHSFKVHEVCYQEIVVDVNCSISSCRSMRSLMLPFQDGDKLLDLILVDNQDFLSKFRLITIIVNTGLTIIVLKLLDVKVVI